MEGNNVGVSVDDLVDIVEAKLVKDRLYYHCQECGVIYDDENYLNPLIDVLRLTGKNHLGSPFNDYLITTGVDRTCFKENYPELFKKMYGNFMELI